MGTSTLEDSPSPASSSENDFFANLEQELTTTLEDSVVTPPQTPSPSKDDDFFSNLERELSPSSSGDSSSADDDFFAMLERDMTASPVAAAEKDLPSPEASSSKRST